MKRTTIKTLFLFSSIFALTGCDTQQSSSNANEQQISSGTSEPHNDISKKLSNIKIKDISSYSKLGYVAKDAKNNIGIKTQSKGRLNSHYKREENSSPRYLAGMIGDNVTLLKSESDNSFLDMPISEFADLGQFIEFHVFSDKVDNNTKYTFTNTTGQGYGSLRDFEYGFNYLLSKQSGKIYSLDFMYGTTINRISFVCGSKVLYLKSDTDYGQTNYWTTIKEENEQLVVAKSNMLEFLNDKINNDYNSDTKYDKYGNILIKDAIYAYNQKELECDLKGHLQYGFEPYTKTIYTYCDGSFYTLDGLEFKKYDNVIFGYGFGGFASDSYEMYFYYLDDDGTYKIGIGGAGSTDCIYEPNGIEKIGPNYDMKLEYDYAVDGAGESVPYTYNDYILLDVNWIYKKLDEYTFIYWLRDIDYNHNVFRATQKTYRNQYVYCITDSYKMFKYDFIEDTENEINTVGYKVKTISEDSLGNIIFSGYDSSFNEFTGYLDENDQVTFEPVITDDSGYDVIYMNPIN